MKMAESGGVVGWFCGAQYPGDADLRTELEKDSGKPQKLRQEAAGCGTSW